MKRSISVFFVILATFVSFGQIQGQGTLGCLELESITVGSGEDPFASGITGVADFNSCTGNTFGQFVVQPEQAWAILARNFESGPFSATIGGTLGHFQGAPYVGPYINTGIKLNKTVKMTGMYWPAVFPGWEPKDWKDDDRPNTETLNIGNFGMIGIEFGTDHKLRLSYALLDFLNDEVNQLPGASLTLPIADGYSMTSAATWNNNNEKWMLYMGVTRLFR